MIDVCGPRKMVPEGALKLSVASHAPNLNPPGWKDLWKLSPFSIVNGGIDVPGMPGVRSKTVENAWQFLKLWEPDESWDRETALAAFDSDCAMRFPHGRSAKAIASYWGETGKRLDYVEARKRIYLPAYCAMLKQPDRQELIGRLRQAAETKPILIWDYDSYSITDVGLENLFETIRYMERAFAHAFIVAIAVRGQLQEFLEWTANS